MSQENAALLTRWYEHFNEDRVDQLLGMLDPDFVYTSSGAFPDFDQVYRGRAGFARFRETQAAPWARFRVELVEILDRGEVMIVEVHLHGEGEGSGVKVKQSFHHAWRFEDGVMVRLDSRTSREEALEAVGLRE